jgi:NitT/TauT family transport system ATP-binding protein
MMVAQPALSLSVPDSTSPMNASAPAIELEHVSKIYRSKREEVASIASLNLTVLDGEFVVIVGPSGCGKSTLLKIISGLLPPTTGQARVAGRVVDRPHRDVGIVFQNALLLPWRNVLENVTMPAEVKKLPRAKYMAQAEELLRNAGLEGFKQKMPWELSGGMQQRVSICRALVHEPKIILMDEPFGALDALTREKMNLDFSRMQRRTGTTVLMITHSIPEAVFLGDRVLVMSERPGKFVASYNIPFSHPRGIAVMADQCFAQLVNTIRAHFYVGVELD